MFNEYAKYNAKASVSINSPPDTGISSETAEGTEKAKKGKKDRGMAWYFPWLIDKKRRNNVQIIPVKTPDKNAAEITIFSFFSLVFINLSQLKF